tara:strand:- start:90 stop:392 length:303 start_codon:yes stop_codon:yes gene_type:complete
MKLFKFLQFQILRLIAMTILPKGSRHTTTSVTFDIGSDSISFFPTHYLVKTKTYNGPGIYGRGWTMRKKIAMAVLDATRELDVCKEWNDLVPSLIDNVNA